VIAGQTNTEDQTTVMRNTNFSVDCSLSFLGATGAMGCGGTGVEGRGTVTGVIGQDVRRFGLHRDRHGRVRLQQRRHRHRCEG
jgi:hypothetical protein